MTLSNIPVARWIELLASPKPVPAGGALSLVTLAGAAALAAKVVRTRRTDTRDLEEWAAVFLRGAEEDADAYRAAAGLGGASVGACLETGFRHLEAATAFLESLAEHFPELPPGLAADLAACGRLGRASTQTLLANLAVNLSEWKDRLASPGDLTVRLDALRRRLEST